MKQTNQIPGLYDPSFEHDNCGIGACVNIKGVKNHQTVDNALKIVETLQHRAGNIPWMERSSYNTNSSW